MGAMSSATNRRYNMTDNMQDSCFMARRFSDSPPSVRRSSVAVLHYANTWVADADDEGLGQDNPVFVGDEGLSRHGFKSTDSLENEAGDSCQRNTVSTNKRVEKDRSGELARMMWRRNTLAKLEEYERSQTCGFDI